MFFCAIHRLEQGQLEAGAGEILRVDLPLLNISINGSQVKCKEILRETRGSFPRNRVRGRLFRLDKPNWLQG